MGGRDKNVPSKGRSGDIRRRIMNKEEFRQWIYDNYNVPGNNCTLAPSMLDGILDYAGRMKKRDRHNFLCEMLPSLPEGIIRRVCYREEGGQ